MWHALLFDWRQNAYTSSSIPCPVAHNCISSTAILSNILLLNCACVQITENGIPNRNPLVMGEWSWVPCETVSCVNQSETFMQYWASLSEEKHLAHFASLYLCDVFLHHWVLLVMKTRAIKVYKLTLFGDFGTFVLPYIACPHYLYIECTDSICCILQKQNICASNLKH